MTPPLLEVRNSIGDTSVVIERVAFITRMYDGNEWAWHVQLYCQYRAVCSEALDLRRFPFVRQNLHVWFVCKKPMAALVPMPFNQVLPGFATFDGKNAKEQAFRANSYKGPMVIGNWRVVNHYLAFIPPSLTPCMPSGNKFYRFQIVIQLEMMPEYYLKNVCLIVFFLCILAVAGFTEDPEAISDRMSVLLTIILTLAAYKSSISSFVPQKPYLTFLDIYVLISFALLFMLAILSIFVSWYLKWGPGKDGGPEVQRLVMKVEGWVTGSFILIWIVGHVVLWFMVWRRSLFRSWKLVVQDDEDELAKEVKRIETHNLNIKNCSRGLAPPPPPPPPPGAGKGSPLSAA